MPQYVTTDVTYTDSAPDAELQLLPCAPAPPWPVLQLLQPELLCGAAAAPALQRGWQQGLLAAGLSGHATVTSPPAAQCHAYGMQHTCSVQQAAKCINLCGS
jgi:hypothetical protein